MPKECVTRLFAVSLLALAVCASADTVDKQTGTCDELQTYLNDEGVKDTRGSHHRRQTSWTIPIYRVGVSDVTADGPEAVHPPKKQCFTCHAVLVPSLVRLETATLDWEPTAPACNQCGCASERKKWQDGLNARAAAEEKAAEDANNKRPNEHFGSKVCLRADTPDIRNAAYWACRADAQAYADTYRQRLDREYAEARKGFGPDPPCAACADCAPGQSSSQCSDKCLPCNLDTGRCQPLCDAASVCSSGKCFPPGDCCCWEFEAGHAGCQIGMTTTEACEGLNVPSVITGQCESFCSQDSPPCSP